MGRPLLFANGQLPTGPAPQYPPIQRHKLVMKSRCYQPVISRPLIAVLYYEARQRRMPMTELVDCLLAESLADSPGWHRASRDWPELAALHNKPSQPDR